MSIEIPPGLTELLQGYTVEVLRHRPQDLLQFAADYFGRLRDARDQELREAAAAVRDKGVNFDGEPMQTESNGEDERSRAIAADEDSDSDFEREWRAGVGVEELEEGKRRRFLSPLWDSLFPGRLMLNSSQICPHPCVPKTNKTAQHIVCRLKKKFFFLNRRYILTVTTTQVSGFSHKWLKVRLILLRNPSV